MITNSKNKSTILIILLATVLLLAGCGGNRENEAITSVDQLADPGRVIGVASDTSEGELVEEKYPDAKVEYFSDPMAPFTSVQTGKIDAFVFDKVTLETAIKGGLTGVKLLDETLGEGNHAGAALSPKAEIPDLKNKVNTFLKEIEEDGTLEDMQTRWLVNREETMPEIDLPETSDIHLIVGTSGTNAPFTYYIGTDLAGYDIELAYRFAAWLGATIEFKVYDYAGIIPAAQTGDVDIVFANLFITPERAEAVEFSDPTYIGEIGVLVRDTEAPMPEFTEFSDLKGKRVSMLTGAPFEDLVKSKEPEVGEFSYFNSVPDNILALQDNKTDAMLNNNAVSELVVNRNPDLAMFPQPLAEGVFGIAFAKGDPLRDQWQAAYDDIPQETKDALWEKWTGADDSAKTLPKQDWPGSNGTVTVAACDTLEPMSYMGEGEEIKGFDIEIILTMAKELDVHVEFIPMEFSAIMASVQAGKADMGVGSIIATDERKESVDFVEYYPAAFVLVVRNVGGTGGDAAGGEGAGGTGTTKTLEDLETANIGVLTGTSTADTVEAALPDSTLLFYNTTADELNALHGGKVEAVAIDEPVGRNMQSEDETITILPEFLDTIDYGYAIGKTEKGEVLKAQLDEFLAAKKEDGTLEELQKKWFDSQDLSAEEMEGYEDLPGENGTIKVAIFQYPPFTVYGTDIYKGYEVEVLTMFCKEYGYAMEFTDVGFDGLVAYVQAGKADIGISGLSITEERKQSMLFSEPSYSAGTVLLVKKDQVTEDGAGFWASVKESFKKTFVHEDRWKLFIKGIGITLFITALSILFGTLLGFLAYMLCRKGNPVANKISRFLTWLIDGMPVVVFLMILYYIVFGNIQMDGSLVAIIGFTLIFASAVFGMLNTAVGTIDIGQTEAAFALGYSDRSAFFKMVLPQAIPRFLPPYKGQITALLKATAIVGYIAVQDLTKMGDIIRSRTYEAFFPLIAVAAIYFVLAAILIFLVNKVEIRVNPRRRTGEDILKGIER